MSPLLRTPRAEGNVAKPSAIPRSDEGLILEAWAQGYLVGSLIIMSFITLANMRRGVLLHKLIFVELILGIWQGFWLFPVPNSAAAKWWLSVAAIPLNVSWFLHNIISWMKIKPFLSRLWSLVFLYTVILSSPYWVVEIYANFSYFNGSSRMFLETRPLELLFRDPWWIITTIYLFVIIKTQYDMTIKDILRISPRFGIMLAAMIISIVFIICDVLSVTNAITVGNDTGINPFWKLAFVFKCLTDSVILDDFKMALDRLRAFKISRLGSFSQDNSDRRTRTDNNLVETWERTEREAKMNKRPLSDLPSSDEQFVHDNSTTFPGYETGRAHDQQKDSFVSPSERFSFQQSDLHRDPKDMVPSAFADLPMPTVEAAYQQEKDGRPWYMETGRTDANLIGKTDYAKAAESDYLETLKELNATTPPASPKRTYVPRRSKTSM